MNTENAHKIRAIIAQTVGFDAKDIQDEDKFIIDYRITYGERKTLLERLNTDFAKDLDFNAFCTLETVADVLQAYAA